MKGREMSKLTLMVCVLMTDICKHQIFAGGKGTECLNSFHPFQGSCYQLSDLKANRIDATEACKPGHLVAITSTEEHHFVSSLLAEAEVDNSWFGLQKRLSWSNGSPLVLGSWQDISTDGEHACFRLDKSKDYIWNDKSCDEDYQFICEYEVNENTTCKRKFMRFQNSCYQVYKKEVSRSTAASACARNSPSGHLVDITSNEEQAFIVGMLSATPGKNGDAWIGLKMDGELAWSDGSTLVTDSQLVWSDGSTLVAGSLFDIRINSKGVCFRMQGGQDVGAGMYRWDDVDCVSNRYRYVCEYEVAAADTTIFTSGAPGTQPLGTDPIDSQNKAGVDVPGVVAGSLIGGAVLIIVVVAVVWFAVKVNAGRYHRQLLTNVATSSSPNVRNQYHTVHRPQGPEYTYIESHLELPREPPQINPGIQEAPPLPFRESTDGRGWSNINNVTSDNTSIHATEEGWVDNTIYDS